MKPELLAQLQKLQNEVYLTYSLFKEIYGVESPETVNALEIFEPIVIFTAIKIQNNKK
jgi:hypothetical protein